MSRGLILCPPEDGSWQKLRAVDGSVWRSKSDLVDQFATSKQYVSMHLRNILEKGEPLENQLKREGEDE